MFQRNHLQDRRRQHSAPNAGKKLENCIACHTRGYCCHNPKFPTKHISYTRHLANKNKYTKVNTRKQTRSTKMAISAQPCVSSAGRVPMGSDSSVPSVLSDPTPCKKKCSVQAPINAVAKFRITKSSITVFILTHGSIG